MEIVLVASAIFILQSILSFIQIRYYQSFMHKITTKYAGFQHYHLYSTMERRFFGASAIAIIVIDGNKTIQECHTLQGKSVFAKFKSQTKFQHQNLVQMIDKFAQEQAIRKLSLWEKAIVKTANSAVVSG
ncbi:transcriptional regulator GutM [Orbus sasakiae]|uniref:Transcriptional regulator GutM n=1 Tax=Orbus sasakiae TaxID=1078475 RepID=A0ABP9MXN1_9GAMM